MSTGPHPPQTHLEVKATICLLKISMLFPFHNEDSKTIIIQTKNNAQNLSVLKCPMYDYVYIECLSMYKDGLYRQRGHKAQVDRGEAVFPCEQTSPELSVQTWHWVWSTYLELHSEEGVQLQYPFAKSETLKPGLSI